jgi:hypothetical protein
MVSMSGRLRSASDLHADAGSAEDADAGAGLGAAVEVALGLISAHFMKMLPTDEICESCQVGEERPS